MDTTQDQQQSPSSSIEQWLKLDSLSRKLSLSAALLAIQFIWLFSLYSSKIAQLNAVPGLILFPLAIFFAAHAWTSLARQYAFLGLLLILSLRLPITLAPELIMLNWLVFACLSGMLLHWLYQQLTQQGCNPKIYWLTLAIIAFNGLSHLGLESPFTHTFHMMNSLESDFQGVDNNQTWECAYDGTSYFAVHCDARHFIAAEKIFTEHYYDPSFSVVLSRYFDSYLKSFIGIEGQRWLSSMLIHFLFWIFSAAAIFRLCALFKLPTSTTQASMLGVASAWGFVSMLAQPAPYMISFAFGALSIWAVVELLKDEERDLNKSIMYTLILVTSTLTYEAYPLMVTSWILLAVFGRWGMAMIVAASQILGGVLWKKVGLEMIVGTAGNLSSDSSGISNITKDLNTWLSVIGSFDVSEFIRLTWVGIQAYAYGNLIYGALAAVALTLFFYKKLQAQQGTKLFWWSIAILNILVLGSAIFIVPQTFHWSPSTGMQPRILFFSFPLNVIALCYIFSCIKLQWFKDRWAYAVPILMFIFANIDQSGFASQAMLFDYGRWGVFWY